MTNDYFQHNAPFARFTTADAVRLNSTLKAVEAGFDKLPTPTELQQGSRNYSVATNVGNAYSVTVPFILTSYSAGLQLTFFSQNANTSSATLNVNGLGAVTIRRFDGTNLIANDIRASALNTVIHDGTSFRLTSMHGGSESLAAASAASAAASAASAATSASTATSAATSASNSASTATSASASAASVLTASRFGYRNTLINSLFWMSQYVGSTTSATITTGVFFRDRWKAGATGLTYSIANSVLTITAGSAQQIVQGRNLQYSGQYTLSWTGTATASVNGTAIANGGQITLVGYVNATIQFNTGTVFQPQFEYSPVRTQYEVRPGDVERLLCFQYYQKSYNDLVNPGTLTDIGMIHSTAVSTINIDSSTVHFPIPMRGVPSLSIYNPAYTNTASSMRNMDLNTDIGISIGYISEKSFLIFSSGLTVGHRYKFHWVANAEL